MFERLTERLNGAFRNLSGQAKLTENNISEAMREVRRALLEADVNYAVVKEFVADVRQKCLGEEVLQSVKPGEQAIKVVHDHLIELLGEENVPLSLTSSPAVIMLVGLHGSGKTTTASKLARHLRQAHQRTPMLVGADLYRPAAMDQLEILGRQLELPVHVERDGTNVAEIAVNGRRRAAREGCDTVILDTAGRLQVDEDLVQELVDLKNRVDPDEILLVADAALGQEAVSVAEHFDQALGISGIVLTKLDGDARGGAALSMRKVTGKPIKFAGVGERPEDFDAFYPDRMAQRILGMGDVVGLVEKAAAHMEEEEAEELEEKLRKNRFDLDDFRSQLQRIRKMGGMMGLMQLLPGMGQLGKNTNFDEAQLNRLEGMVCSMTPKEREDPAIINPSRKRRIARGSGVSPEDVTALLKQFGIMRKMIRQMGKSGKGGKEMPDMEQLQGMMGGGGEGMPDLSGAMGGGMPGLGLGGGGGKKGNRNQKSKKKRRKNKKKR